MMFSCENHERKFTSRLIKSTCVYPKCNATFYIGAPFCRKHLKGITLLEIKKSNKAGYGVFATSSISSPISMIQLPSPSSSPLTSPKKRKKCIFKRGEFIVSYYGEILNEDQINERYGINTIAPYAIKIDDEHYVDGACFRGVASMINDYRNLNQTENYNYPNVEYAVDETMDINLFNCHVFAITDIYQGDELLADYTLSFWNGLQSKHKTYTCITEEKEK